MRHLLILAGSSFSALVSGFGAGTGARGMRCVGASHAVSRGAYEVTRAGEARLGDAAERRGARFESCKLVLLAATLVLYVV